MGVEMMAARCGSRVDSSGSRCVNAVEGSLTHVNRRLGLCHRPPSSSKRVRTVGIGGEVGAHFPLERSDQPRSVGAFLARRRKEAKRRPRRATTLTRRRHNRRRTHRRWRCLPSGESSGDANPTPFGEYRPPRATRDAQSTEPFSPVHPLHVSAARSPRNIPLSRDRMASSLGLRAMRARVATQSSRSMVVRAAVSATQPVVVKREGAPRTQSLLTGKSEPLILNIAARPHLPPSHPRYLLTRRSPTSSTHTQTSSPRTRTTTSPTTSSRRSGTTSTSDPIIHSASSSPSSNPTLTKSTAKTPSPPTTASTPWCPPSPTSTASWSPPTTSRGPRTIPTTSTRTPSCAATRPRTSSRC